MSVEGTWDLRATSAPRSLCVYVAPSASASINYGGISSEAPSSTNPFDAASSSRSSTSTHDSRTAAHGVVFGTERGSLHYRTFAPPRRSARSQSFVGTSSRSAAWNQPQQPLGLSSSSQSQTNRNIPRGYLPVDLQGATPGAVVAVIRASSSPVNQPIFLLLVDDNRGTSSSSKAGAFAAHMVTLRHGSFTPIGTASSLPRMSCATFHPNCGFVYAAGWSVGSFFPEALEGDESKQRRSPATLRPNKRIVFGQVALPSPGTRSCQDAIEVICGGRVTVVAVGNSFFAVPGSEPAFSGNPDEGPSLQPKGDAKEIVKIMSFAQSSQVHPVIVFDIQDQSLDDGWSCLFVASGRECAVVDVFYNESLGSITCGPPRHGPVTLASPILAAATSWPWVAVLTSDGLVSIRSPSCMAIPLRTVEVGTRPNDYFVLRTLRDDETASQSTTQPWLIAISYQGEGKILQCQPDTTQDLADRLMRLAIDAFGSNGFPRSELAEAVNASFTSTSYVGPEPTPHARALLRQYLEAVLGLADFDSGGSSGWPTEIEMAAASNEGHYGAFDEAGRTAISSSGQRSTPMVSSASPAMLVSGTALLCLVCSQLSPPNSSLANNAAMTCVSKVGVVFAGATIPSAAVNVCETVADKLLREAKNNFSLLNASSPTPIASSQRLSSNTPGLEFTEAAVWLLRSCGRHERAIEVLHERLHQHKVQPEVGRSGGGFWSQIKYESYTATHLSEIWASGEDQGCRLVLRTSATRRLLESNPRLGISVFTAMHPQNESQWASMSARDDPLAHPSYPLQVVELLKAVNPAVPYDTRDTQLPSSIDDDGTAEEGTAPLPLESGRALAVTYLESAIGISSGRPTTEDVFDSLPADENFEERAANLHDELSYLLLEGVIAERGDEDNDTDTTLGRLYRGKLRRLLKWPNAKVHSERLLASLPSSFLQEHALLLGRLGRHEDALRILYCDLQSLDLALEYCDALNERRRARSEMEKNRRGAGASEETDCAYLPLVRVALQSDPDTERGTTAAIQVLALRRSSIDRAAALRLLPHNVPVSAVARPFLIPALVDSESQVRRLTVTAALLRAKYVTLKKQLTEAQIKSQANLHAVPALRSLGLGDPLHSSKSFKGRPAHSASSTFPEVMIVKHFFPRYLVIQAKITNSATAVDGRTLGDVAFVVAESSEEAIQPTVQVPLKALPFQSTGSAWCCLAAAPQRIDGTAILTCELRYTVLAVDATTGAPLSFSGGMATSGMGRTYVEELQDMEVNAAHFL